MQKGTKLETQCVVIHSSLQLLRVCLCLSVWVSGCACVRVCSWTSARRSAGIDVFSFFFLNACVSEHRFVFKCVLNKSTTSRGVCLCVCVALWHSARRIFKPISSLFR